MFINRLIILAFILISTLSAEETEQTTEPTPEVSEEKQPDPAASELEINPGELACLSDADCLAIDSGCCRFEKRVAINKKMAITAKLRLYRTCRALKKATPKLCQNREKLYLKGEKWPQCLSGVCKMRE